MDDGNINKNEMNLRDLPFQIGDRVYLVTDKEQKERIITGMMVRVTGVSYIVCMSDEVETYHYDIELSHDRDEVKALS